MAELPPGFREQAYRVYDLEIDRLKCIADEFTESPIEAAFMVAFCLDADAAYGGYEIVLPGEERNDLTAEWVIIPQESIFDYRVDFLIFERANPRVRVVVECDGHAFHERTKEQAQRDRSRDRTLQSNGYKVFRFTGSEIYRNVFLCAAEVLEELLGQQQEERGL